MDRRPAHRDRVYCHQCESEWYRDEGGLQCPECHSDFVEVIEAQNDPREDHGPPIPDRPESAPDPDEDNVENMGWQRAPDGSGHTYTYRQSFNSNSQGQQGMNPLMAGVTSMLGNIMGARPSQTPWQSGAPPVPPNRPTSAPGEHFTRTTQTAPGTTIRSGGGPGFSWSVTTSRGSAGFSGDRGQAQAMPAAFRLLFGPQQGQRHEFDHFGPQAQFPHHHHPNHQPFEQDFFSPMSPFGPLLAQLFDPANARSGDGVYSQEALDRIVSQLMEQHASGNAPGPATANAIASLPERTINEKDLGDEGKAECSICMEEVNIGQTVTELPCHHWFHGECVKAWLSEHDTCPHCRQGIMPQDDANNSRSRQPGERPRHDVPWGQGTRDDPYVVSESPERTRRPYSHTPASPAGPSSRGHAGARPQGTHQQAVPGNNDNEAMQTLYSRMRDAFGGGGAGPSSS